MKRGLLNIWLTLFQCRLLVFCHLFRGQRFGISPNNMMMPNCTSRCCNRWIPRGGMAPWKITFVHSHYAAVTPDQKSVTQSSQCCATFLVWASSLKPVKLLPKRQVLMVQPSLNTQNRFNVLVWNYPNISLQSAAMHNSTELTPPSTWYQQEWALASLTNILHR